MSLMMILFFYSHLRFYRKIKKRKEYENSKTHYKSNVKKVKATNKVSGSSEGH